MTDSTERVNKPGAFSPAPGTPVPDNDIWIMKGPCGESSSIRVSSMTSAQLRKCLAHCDMMLHGSEGRPGRLALADMADETVLKCKGELLARHFESIGYPRSDCLDDMRALLDGNPSLLDGKGQCAASADTLFSGLPERFRSLPASFLMLALARSLGQFEAGHFSARFLLQLGLDLTRKELRSTLFERGPDGRALDRMDVAAKRLSLPEGMRPRPRHGGLTFAELALGLSLKSADYSDIDTASLELVCGKLGPALSGHFRRQAGKWLSLKSMVESALAKSV